MPARRIVICALAGLSALGLGGCGESACRSLGANPLGQILGALFCTDEQIFGAPPQVSMSVEPTPTAEDPIAVGEEITLHTLVLSSGANPLVGIEWDFNQDGSWDTGAFAGPSQSAVLSQAQLQVKHRYDTPGTHHPVVRITNSVGATATATGSVPVGGYTPPDGERATTATPRADPSSAPDAARSAVRAALPPGERLVFAVLSGRRARAVGVPALRGRLQLRYAQPGSLIPGADPAPPPAVQRLLGGRWKLRLRRRGRSVRGRATVRIGKGRFGCARVRIGIPLEGPRTGTLKLIGGTGPAARLALRWSFELASLGDDATRMGGAIAYRLRAKPRRAGGGCRLRAR